MSRKLDIKKGDVVFAKIESGSNAARYKEPFSEDTFGDWVKEVEVVSVGKKYITISNGSKFKIDEDYREHYTIGGSNHKLYVSKQEIIDEMEFDEIHDRLRTMFSVYCSRNLSLDQLRRIKSIIEE